MNIVMKNRGKKPEKKFKKKTRIWYRKILEKNRLKKVRKMFFKKHMNIVTKNGEKKSEKKILPELYYIANKKR